MISKLPVQFNLPEAFSFKHDIYLHDASCTICNKNKIQKVKHGTFSGKIPELQGPPEGTDGFRNKSRVQKWWETVMCKIMDKR